MECRKEDIVGAQTPSRVLVGRVLRTDQSTLPYCTPHRTSLNEEHACLERYMRWIQDVVQGSRQPLCWVMPPRYQGEQSSWGWFGRVVEYIDASESNVREMYCWIVLGNQRRAVYTVGGGVRNVRCETPVRNIVAARLSVSTVSDLSYFALRAAVYGN